MKRECWFLISTPGLPHVQPRICAIERKLLVRQGVEKAQVRRMHNGCYVKSVQRVFRRWLLPSNVAGEFAFSDQILIVTAFLRSPVQPSVAAAGQTRHM